MAQQTTSPPARPKPPSGPSRSGSIVPYVFLAIAIVSILVSGIMFWHQHEHKDAKGTRVIAKVDQPSSTLAITVFAAPDIYHCSAGGDNTVVLSWSTTGAQSVSIFVDNSTKPFVSKLQPNSQQSVPAPCAPKSHTYHLTALASDGRTMTKSATTRGV